MSKAIRFAVTGGIAAGKSFTCEKLKEAADRKKVTLKILDVDRLRAEVLEDHTNDSFASVQASLIEFLGAEIVSSSGGIDRRRLSDIIFADQESLDFCEKIIDPVLLSAIQQRMEVSADIVLLDWALVLEKQALSLVDNNVLLVTCPEETQILRLSGGDLPDSQVRRRMSLQFSAPRKRKEILHKLEQPSKEPGLFLELNTEITPSANVFDALLLTMLRAGENCKAAWREEAVR